MASGYPKLECLTTLTNMGVVCVAPANANAIQVKQQMTVPILFGGLFGGKSTTTLTAIATASARGSGATVEPYNVAIIVDATASMGGTDSDSLCSSTRMSCALQGVRVLLQSLSPCNIALSSCRRGHRRHQRRWQTWSARWTGSPSSRSQTCQTSTVADAYDCSSTNATSEPYTFPQAGLTTYTPLNSSTYEDVGFSSDYKTSDTAATLNPAPKTSSGNNLVKATGGLSSCTAMGNPGGEGTYYAGVIYAAQSALVAEQAAFPGSQNVLIIISDGAASSSGKDNNNNNEMGSASTTASTYPATKQECAQQSRPARMWQRPICLAMGPFQPGSTRSPMAPRPLHRTAPRTKAQPSPHARPCRASPPRRRTSSPTTTASQGGGACISASRPTTGIPQIFAIIAGDLAVAHLIPNGTT